MEEHREVELKLEASPEDLGRLARHPLVQTLSQGRAVTHVLDSAYFDTPDHDLADAGFGLRVRLVGNQRFQTLKAERSAAGGLFERTEYETPIEADRPDLALIPEATLRERLQLLVGAKPLVPAFRTAFRRSRRVLRNGETEWTLDVDLGEIVAGDAHLPIHEVELELVSGEPARLFEFALLLQEQFDLLPSTRSKAERGYALALGEPAAARSMRRVTLEPDAKLEDALIAILSQCLEQFTRNADCAFEGTDPEGVHQMRVGVRRLRAALAAFAPLLPREQIRIFRSELRWLGNQLGSARDLDVFTEILARLESHRGNDAAFKRLSEEAHALREECYAAVREVVRSQRYARLVLELGGWITARAWRNQPLSEESTRLFLPAADFASSLLERRHRKVRRLGARLDESDDARHELRIQLKMLRYTGEFFRDLFPGQGAKRFLRRISRMQSSLGRLNDVAMSERILATLLARLGSERVPAHDRAAGFIEGWVAQLAHRELRELEEIWERFERTRPFWH